jgi:hypothetical protein
MTGRSRDRWCRRKKHIGSSTEFAAKDSMPLRIDLLQDLELFWWTDDGLQQVIWANRGM